MTEMAISPLRRRMIEDMTVRNFVEKTRNDYIRHVKNLAAFLGRSPDTATAEDLRLYQLHLTEGGIRPPTINAAVSALRFFFSVTLDRPAVTRLLRPRGQHHQAGLAAHAAPQLRDPSAGAEHRYPRDPGAARARQARHHGALYAGRHQHHPHGHEPARSAHAAADEARRAARLARQRSWPVPLWRSRTSSATTGPPGARPTPAM